MQIQKINNITFGYNKQLNSKLVKELEKDPKNMENAIISQFNDFCNETEDLLDLYYAGTARESELTYSLLSAKHTLADMVERKYPNLKFKEKEREFYQQTARDISRSGIDEYPWQFEMVDELSEPEFHDDFAEQAEVQAKPVTLFDKLDAVGESEIVERYMPSFSSPSGFSDIAGMQTLKEELYDKIINPANNPEAAKADFAEYGKRAPRGIMLFGPPGCGKTFITEALSSEAQIPMFKLKISNAGSKYINETSENYQKAFDYVAECAKMIDGPCFLFIDEMDGLTKGRDGDSSSEDLKQMGTLLNLIETARDRNIIVIGATNKYDIVDPAIKRRFDEQVYVGMPDEEMRSQVFEKTLAKWLKGVELSKDKDAMKLIAQKTEGFPTSALVIIADKASDIARRDKRRPILVDDILKVIQNSQNLRINEKNYLSKQDSRNKIGF